MNINPLLNPNYIDFHKSTAFEVWVYGSSNSGKSYSIADKLLLQSVWQKDKPALKAVVARKTLPSLKRTALDIIEKRARTLGLPFDLNKQDLVAQTRNLQWVFLSLNNKEDFNKLKSMTDVDFLWFNELLELREEDYDEGVRRCRGGYSDFAQLIADFNPEDRFAWVFRRGWESPLGKEIVKLHRTVYENHPDYLATDKAKAEIERLRRYKGVDDNQYTIYFEGEWGCLKGVIFNWDIVELPQINFDEIWYGGDFGFSVDPAATMRIYRKADEYWVEEVLYETGLTNQQMGETLKAKGITRQDQTIWDSAEPKSIQELCDLGLTAIPAIKGPDSVRAGIDFLKTLKIHIVDGSMNLIREAKRYTWKIDKNGNSLNVPIEENDHAMAAIRYAIYTRMGGFRPQYTYKAY
jgi:phage terminase large subunit